MSSFSSTTKATLADAKKVVKDNLPMVNNVLDKGCQIGTAVSAVYPAVKPYAQGVCAAAGVTGVLVQKK